MNLRRCLGAAFVLVLGLASVGMAQQMDTALIVGTVSDTTGAVIPGVSVTFNHVETGTTYTAETNESGNFRSNPLRIGTYLVIVESDGFKTYSGSGVNLSIGDVRELDVSLEVGRGDGSHRGRGPPRLCCRLRDAFPPGTVIGNRQIVDLPLNRPRLSAACRHFVRHRAFARPGCIDWRPARHRGQLRDRRHGQQQPVHRFSGPPERNRQALDRRHRGVQGHHQWLCRGIPAEPRPALSAFRSSPVRTLSTGTGFGFFRDEAMDARKLLWRRPAISPRSRANSTDSP